jgi:hypothetical protein
MRALRHPWLMVHSPIDPRLRAQLDALIGEPLSQVSINLNNIRLAFWGAELATPSRDIVIEAQAIGITTPDTATASSPALSDYTATTLLHALGHQLTAVDVDDGLLRLAFDDGLVLEVPPHERWEAWQINSNDGLLIVCTPGGGLTIWYPPTAAPPRD